MKITFPHPFALALAVGGLALPVGLAVPLLHAVEASEGAKSPVAQIAVDRSPVNRTGSMPASFAPIIKKAAPSVVKIEVTAKAQPALNLSDDDLNGLTPFGGIDPRRFFEQRGMDPRRMRIPQEQGSASGVIVTGDGYILTNNHVVDHAEKVQITLHDGRSLTAKVVGTDPKSDLAVVKVDGAALPAITFADSSQVEVGDLVLAAGNPFGLGESVSLGMVSAMGRATMGLDYEDFIQTDAAINPGNSGGPLVNLRGEVVGLNTAIASNSGGSEGIGFAIPIPMVMFVARQLVEHGSVPRAYLGVALDKQFDRKEADRLGMVRPVGTRVEAVTRGSPADLAGIRPDDVILEFDGRPVEDDDHLMSIVGMTPLDSMVQLVLFRDRERMTVRMKVASRRDFE